MKILKLKKREVVLNEYIKRTALETDYKELIDEPTIIIDADDGQVKIIYDHLGNLDTADIVEALKTIKYHEGKRARGLTSRSRIFGFRPRLQLRADFCSSSSLASDFKNEHALVAGLALKLEEYYQKYDGGGYEKHKKITEEKVKPSYRIEGKSIFTSGIINKNNPLKYHFDTGNFNEVYSCMIVFKKDVDGGYLSVPEYDVGFKLPNNSIFLFDGQGLLHGVTPIRYTSSEAYRYSVVYYSLKNMWQCLEIDEELARIRTRKTSRERIRMDNPMNEEDKAKKEIAVKSLIKRRGKQ